MRVLIVRNNYNSKAIDASILLETYFATQGIDCATYDADFVRFDATIVDQVKIPDIDSFDMAVVLGGDGTLLGTAAQIQSRRIPILGINFGNLGFMVNDNETGVVPMVMSALAGELTPEYRANLCIDVYCSDEEDADISLDDPLPETYTKRLFALNEMVLSRGAEGRILDFAYAISGSKISDMRGDGLVVSTASGSTAYALSLGGPLVSPGFPGMIIVPVAPHTLQSRAVITQPSDVIEIILESSSGNRQATMFIDGELIQFEKPIRRVVITTGEEPTILLRRLTESFYDRASRTFFSSPNYTAQ